MKFGRIVQVNTQELTVRFQTWRQIFHMPAMTSAPIGSLNVLQFLIHSTVVQGQLNLLSLQGR